MKFCVFTAVTGPSLDELRDDLRPMVPGVSPDLDCFCFTNLEAYKAPEGWTTVHISTETVAEVDVTPHQVYRLLARSIKLRPHLYIPSFDTYRVSGWVDGNVEFLEDPVVFFRQVATIGEREPGDPLFASFIHHERSSIGQELTAVKAMRPDAVSSLSVLEAYCRKIKFPDSMGLLETCVVIRSNHEAVFKLNNLWWKLLLMTGLRDQVVLPVALFEMKRHLTPTRLTYRWRENETGDMHIMGWPKAPWVHRLKHTNKT